jgi:hypothetical protein
LAAGVADSVTDAPEEYDSEQSVGQLMPPSPEVTAPCPERETVNEKLDPPEGPDPFPDALLEFDGAAAVVVGWLEQPPMANVVMSVNAARRRAL